MPFAMLSLWSLLFSFVMQNRPALPVKLSQ
jgi:hypothetical protein